MLLGRPVLKVGATEVTPTRLATLMRLVPAALWIARMAGLGGVPARIEAAHSA